MAETAETMNTPSATPAGTSKDASFWDKTARKYAASPIKNVAAYEETLERVRSYLKPEHRVLEVGMGTGSTALILAPEVAQYTASDTSAEMVAIAREKAKEAGVANLQLCQGSLPDPALAQQQYDVILAFNLLHLVRELPTALEQLTAALPPGGLLISKTVCLAEQTRLWSIPIALMRAIGKAPYVQMLTFAKLEAMIADAGLEIIETGLYPAPWSRFVVARKPA